MCKPRSTIRSVGLINQHFKNNEPYNIININNAYLLVHKRNNNDIP